MYVSTVSVFQVLYWAVDHTLRHLNKSGDRSFTGLLFWKSNLQINIEGVEDWRAELVKDATYVVSLRTNQRHQLSDGISLLPVSKPSKIQHPVFQTPVEIEHTMNNNNNSIPGQDVVRLESTRQTRRSERIACRPAGWYPDGKNFASFVPTEMASLESMEWISFRAQLNPQMDSLVENLRRKLWEMGDRTYLRWGTEQKKIGNSDKFSLFIGT